MVTIKHNPGSFIMKKLLFVTLLLICQITTFDIQPVEDQVVFIPIGEESDPSFPVVDTSINDDSIPVIDQELTEAEKLKLGFTKQTVQPEWIDQMGIKSDDITRRVTSSEDFIETVSPLVLVAFDSKNQDKEHRFVVSFVKASDWVFVTFTDSESDQAHQFFFPYSSLATEQNIFLREVLEECVLPVVIEPQPPTVAKCHYFYKKVTEAYNFSVKEVGPVEGADLMECYVESVKKMTRQPRVEILCVEGAIEDAQYKQLSREHYNDIKANYKDNGDGTFTGEMEETEVTTVNGK
jgi:hypothetical protein